MLRCLQIDPTKRVNIDDLVSENLKNQKYEEDKISTSKSLDMTEFEFVSTDFAILEPLDGKEGKVFKAFDKKNKRFVALKSIEVETQDLVENLNEIEILKCFTIKEEKESEESLMSHWETYIDKTKEGKISLKFSLEYGLADLNSLLERREKYTENEIFFILKQLAKGLAALTRKEICHGNICAENVVVFAEGSWFSYKFVDFGFSYKVVKGSENYEIKGLSDLYASPQLKKILNENEQSRNPSDHFDPFKADIYALGVLCLMMMGKKNQVVDIQNDLTILDKEMEYGELKEIVKKMIWPLSENRISIKELTERLDYITTSKPPIDHLYLHQILCKNLQDLSDDSVKYQHYTKINDHESSLGMNLVYVGNEKNPLW